mmetsp:Transcript_16989/g.43076  ORF Transcript_16989/g.43076 Transcript_16989/m.43076 type:complete len:225 (+) Transcript_16989:44-718(+)
MKAGTARRITGQPRRRKPYSLCRQKVWHRFQSELPSALPQAVQFQIRQVLVALPALSPHRTMDEAPTRQLAGLAQQGSTRRSRARMSHVWESAVARPTCQRGSLSQTLPPTCPVGWRAAPRKVRRLLSGLGFPCRSHADPTRGGACARRARTAALRSLSSSCRTSRRPGGALGNAPLRRVSAAATSGRPFACPSPAALAPLPGPALALPRRPSAPARVPARSSP